MKVRVLLAVLAITLLVWIGAAVALVSTQRQAGHERDFLLRFVCESVAIRIERDGLEAETFAVRFGKIMREAGASCKPKVPGLP